MQDLRGILWRFGKAVQRKSQTRHGPEGAGADKRLIAFYFPSSSFAGDKLQNKECVSPGSEILM